jgi:hypothetical protein
MVNAVFLPRGGVRNPEKPSENRLEDTTQTDSRNRVDGGRVYPGRLIENTLSRMSPGDMWCTKKHSSSTEIEL